MPCHVQKPADNGEGQQGSTQASDLTEGQQRSRSSSLKPEDQGFWGPQQYYLLPTLSFQGDGEATKAPTSWTMADAQT